MIREFLKKAKKQSFKESWGKKKIGQGFVVS